MGAKDHDVLLDVPYFAQPTSDTCGATCLKMMATYLCPDGNRRTNMMQKDIMNIHRDIMKSPHRPFDVSYADMRNMRWWLENEFSGRDFLFNAYDERSRAIGEICNSIRIGTPVICGTDHSQTDGHYILVVGFKGDSSDSEHITLICHDPYGKAGYEGRWAKGRFIGGFSVAGGGESGPGKNVRYTYQGARFNIKGKKRFGSYYMIRTPYK